MNESGPRTKKYKRMLLSISEERHICNSTYIFKQAAKGSLSPTWETDKEELVYLNYKIL